jgi:hypothetical protein
MKDTLVPSSLSFIERVSFIEILYEYLVLWTVSIIALLRVSFKRESAVLPMVGIHTLGNWKQVKFLMDIELLYCTLEWPHISCVLMVVVDFLKYSTEPSYYVFSHHMQAMITAHLHCYCSAVTGGTFSVVCSLQVSTNCIKRDGFSSIPLKLDSHNISTMASQFLYPQHTTIGWVSLPLDTPHAVDQGQTDEIPVINSELREKRWWTLFDCQFFE